MLKRDYARTLRVETIANSAGRTAQLTIVAQKYIGFLNTMFLPSNAFMASASSFNMLEKMLQLRVILQLKHAKAIAVAAAKVH